MSSTDSAAADSSPTDLARSDSATGEAIARRPPGMRAFILISLALHIPLFIYPVLRLAGWLELDLLMTIAVLVPIACSQTISRTLLRNAKGPVKRFIRHVADFILGISPIVLINLLLVELLVLVTPLTSYNGAILVLSLSGAIALLGIWLAMAPKVATVSLTSRHLKAPLRFVQITDVHVGSRNQAFLEKIVNRVNAVEPEFLCITGDFIDATGVSRETISPLAKVDCPIYFSIGNHERYEDLDEIIERLSSLGVQVLRTDTVGHRGDVQVIGIDDRDDALQVQRELGKLTIAQDQFALLMYHRPLGLTSAAAAGVDLMISGHTHNGQIFPFNLIVNRVFSRVVGLYKEDETHLYVSQGTGTWGPVMRVGTRAEITLFEINNPDLNAI